MTAALIAAFDIGTTTTKGVLIDRIRGIVCEAEHPYETYYGPTPGVIEQDPDDWWRALCAITAAFWRAGWTAEQVGAIALTGQMQDVIPIDGQGHALGRAILYSDRRAEVESAALHVALEQRGVPSRALSALDGAAPLAKLRWLAGHEPARLAACERILFSSKDYIVARLCGARVTDPTTAGTTACLDLRQRRWRDDWLGEAGLSARHLPALLVPGQVAGTVTAEAARASGFAVGTPVDVGMGDAAAATLAAGLTSPGAAYLYLGTTAWAATLTASPGEDLHGLRHLPYIDADLLVRAAPLLNAGSTQQWIIDILDPDGAPTIATGPGEGATRGGGAPAGERPHERFERLLHATPGRSDGVLFLPYLNGERCPVYEPRAMGTFLHLGPRSGRGELAWAVLEGICFALREVLETLDAGAGSLRLLGGMARSALLRQLVADVTGRTVTVAALPAASSALAAAVPLAVASGWFTDPAEAVAAWFPPDDSVGATRRPQVALVERYTALYRRYQQLYPLLSRLSE